MSITELKRNINKQLEEMDEEQLMSVLYILKGILKEEETVIHKKEVERKIKIGLKQLENGEGQRMDEFLTEISINYGSKTTCKES